MKVIDQFRTLAEHASDIELVNFAAQAMREGTWYCVSDIVCDIWCKRGGECFEDLCYEAAWNMAQEG